MDKNLKFIPKIKLNSDTLKVYCNSGSIGTHIEFRDKNVDEVIDYFKQYGIELKNVGSGASFDIHGKQESNIDLQFPQFTSVLIRKGYIILAVPDSEGLVVIVRLILKK